MNRNKTIQFRVSNAEEKLIRNKAEKSGLKMSEYIRKSAMSDKFTFADNASLYRLNSNIRMIGNNVNQIARVANTCNSVTAKDISDLQIHIKKIDDLVSDYIAGLKIRGDLWR